MNKIRNEVKKAHHSTPDVIIGKKGITHEVLEEISRRLDKKRIVKVKMLRTATGPGEQRKELARIIADKLSAKLMGIRGKTFILYREKRQDLLPDNKRPSRSRVRWPRKW